MNERVAIIGLGYVGLPIALRAVEAQYDVVGVEVDPKRYDALTGRRSYVEDVSDVALARAFDSGRFGVASRIADIQAFDILGLVEALMGTSHSVHAMGSSFELLGRGCGAAIL